MKRLQILGTGCPKCTQLAAATEVAATSLRLEYQLEKVSDLKRIMTFGVIMTPALVVDGVVNDLFEGSGAVTRAFRTLVSEMRSAKRPG